MESINFHIPSYIPEALGLAQMESPEDAAFLEGFVQRWGGLDWETIRRALQEAEGEDRFFAVCVVAGAALEIMQVPSEFCGTVLDDFVDRWGRLTQETFVRVLQAEESDETDRLFAIFALGYLGTFQAREHLLPFLHASRTPELWASALALGQLKDERALPVLTLLPDEALSAQRPLDWEQRILWYRQGWIYDTWSVDVVHILGSWGKPEVVPVLCQALENVLHLAQREPPPDARQGVRWFHGTEQTKWRWYQEAIVYALGQLGAFGAFTALQGVASKLPLWMVHLVMGYLHGRFPDKQIVTWSEQPELREEVARHLAQQFGLLEEAQRLCLTLYEDKFLSRNRSTVEKLYQHIKEQRKKETS